jgi:hypothetical protein
MKTILITSLIISTLSLAAFSQSFPDSFTTPAGISGLKQEKIETKTETPASFEDSNLIINSDTRVDSLIQIHREENARKNGIEGYRLQIYQGTKDEAYQVKARFMGAFENIKSYIIFQSPDFRVRIGDFRNRSEALYVRHQIRNHFPDALLLEDMIALPELIAAD